MKAIIKHKNDARGVVDKGQENIKAVIFDIKGQSVFVKQYFKVLDDRILDAKGRIQFQTNGCRSRIKRSVLLKSILTVTGTCF